MPPVETATSTPQEPPVFVPPTVPELLEALEQKDHIIREQQLLLKLLEEKLRLSRLQRFGASSEKLSFQVDSLRVYADSCGLILAFLGSAGRNAATILSLR